MASGRAGKIKLLFLMSRDFGELNNAVYFVMGQEFDSVFLIPASLYGVNEKGLPVRTHPYQSMGEVIAVLDREQPDIVFLFSGYLYVNNRIFPMDELEQLVRALRQRRCRIVTSDPFSGLLARMDDTTFDWEPHMKEELNEQFARVHAVLNPIPHLYHADPKGFATTEALSFSNRGMVRPAAYMPCPQDIQEALGLDPSRKHWVFVLSTMDYWLLTRDESIPFDDLLTDRLFEVLSQGRQPVLVAPERCISAVARRCLTKTQLLTRRDPRDLGFTVTFQDNQMKIDLAKDAWGKLSQELFEATGGLVLLPFCRHDRFLSLILDAEYAFYWNIFSNSLLVRAMNRLPFFFFDRGHMARASASLFQRVSQCYYVGGIPSSLDITQPIEPGLLARRTAEQEQALNAAADNLLKSPAPRDVVDQLMQRSLKEE